MEPQRWGGRDRAMEFALSRRSFLGAAAALAAALALPACGDDDGGTSSTAAATPSTSGAAPSSSAATTAAAAETTAAGSTAATTASATELSGELTFYFAAGPDEAKARQKVIDAFVAKHPGLKINNSLAGQDSVQQVLTACAGGACPDVIMAFEVFYAPLAQRGVFADLAPFLARDQAWADQVLPDYAPDLLKAFLFDGVQVALPEQFAGTMLYYNKTLFEQAGVAAPPADWTDASWNYDAFLTAAKALTTPSGSDRPDVWGFVDGWAPFFSAPVWAMNNGVEWFTPPVNPERTNVADPKFVEGMQFYADLINVHKVSPSPELTASVAAPDLFLGGKAAMMLSGHWQYPSLLSAGGLEFEAAVLPVGPQGQTARSDIGTTGLAIAADSKNPDAAWEFLKFSSGPEGQALIAETGLFVPVLKSVANSPSFLDTHTRIEHPEVFVQAIEHVNYLPITPALNTFLPQLQDESNKLFSGQQSAEEYAKNLEPVINAALQAA